MANKKRKKTAKRGTRKTTKEVRPEHELPGGFWRQIVAILMIALAVFFVVTWFGHGGTVLNNIHQVFLNVIGFAAYFVPALLVYLAVKIFRSEDNRVAVPVYIASFLMVIWIAGIAAIWQNGGYVGGWLNSLMTNVLDQAVVILIYIVLVFITTAFILQLSPVTFFKGTKNYVKSGGKKSVDEEDGDGKKKKVGRLEIKVNSGLGASEPASSAPTGKLLRKSAIKSPAKAPEPVKEPTALIAVSDPDWKMPSTDLLEKKQSPADAGNIQQNAYIIKSTLAEFGIEVEMEGANVGPRVTQYTMRPPAGVNLSKILARDKELALNLAVDKIRIEAPIPGTRSVGVEIPNARSADVRMRGVLESSEWKKSTDSLTFAVGKDISGKAVVANLAKMPHLLIAGTTGSGKSVMTNTLISSLLYRNAPSDMKLIIVDPKQVEMAQYQDIPHLLTPIITSTEKALSAMKWAVGEMERRYTLMAEEKVKNIGDYNTKIAKSDNAKTTKSDGTTKEGKMPYIVIIIDEMADLMMMAGKDLEMLIVRIAQKGRAAGIHLVLATQRPEVKVITGLIKANIPGRIAFAVGSQMDSRIMLDQGGAEKLLGKGDMLLLTTEMMGKPRRIQGAWASDDDIAKVTDFLRAQRSPEYNDEVVSQQVAIKGMGGGSGGAGDLGRRFDPDDPIVRKAVEISLSKGKFSTAMLQTYLGKGHGFVSGLAIWFEDIGVIGPQNGNKPRELLITSMEEFDELSRA
ncbi:MAG: DNA translocase FtsK 4TM domain-containing protein [Candidatus Saccharimonadaceae bacterium]|nr:DNA translocase FtsK 4TM domain-containing protein [Candidatus Saccharimonadaceae bacterium]